MRKKLLIGLVVMVLLLFGAILLWKSVIPTASKVTDIEESGKVSRVENVETSTAPLLLMPEVTAKTEAADEPAGSEPVLTETPMGTWPSSPTEAPKSTTAPAQMEVPEQTPVPVQTEVPKPTQTPAPTEAPTPTEAPEPTQAPTLTEAPAPTVAPTEAPAHNHAWDDGTVTTAATCGSDGVKTFACGCGETKIEVIPVSGEHSWVFAFWWTEPKCNMEGYANYNCSICGANNSFHTPTNQHNHTPILGCGNVPTQYWCECGDWYEVIDGSCVDNNGDNICDLYGCWLGE